MDVDLDRATKFLMRCDHGTMLVVCKEGYDARMAYQGIINRFPSLLGNLKKYPSKRMLKVGDTKVLVTCEDNYKLFVGLQLDALECDSRVKPEIKAMLTFRIKDMGAFSALLSGIH